MKKLFLPVLLTGLLYSTILAQDFSGIKICINPGHGGHDSNDRFIQATGFWESEGNLSKGLYLQKILEGFSAEIVMTRTTNTTADDLPLSQIVAIANSNDVDYFHAIHSNAYNAQSNYTLLLFQGRDGAPTYPSSLDMANYVASEIYTAHRTTAKYSRGDFDFYGTGKPYLGVFKGLNMPGTLSEGSFHDYVPESWRLKNQAYLKHEAWAIAKAFISYFNLTPISTGMVAGVVRDPEQRVDYFALSSTSDVFKPINNIKVELEPGGRTYSGDADNNGFFMFDSLAPGNYKVIIEAENYFKDSAEFTVAANKTVFADAYLQYDTTIAPLVLDHYPVSTADSVKASASVSISFNRIMNKQSAESAFKITPAAAGTFTWENGDKTMVFKPDLPFEKATEYNVSESTGALSKWNVPIDSAYSFSFITKNRNRITLLQNYPSDGQQEVTPYVQLRLVFDAPVYNSSLAGQINIYNSSNERIPVKNVKIFSEDGLGKIYFEPASALAANTEYKLVLGAGITDTDDLPLGEQKEIIFRTGESHNDLTYVLDNFETAEGWQTSLTGADESGTGFSVSSEQKFSGAKSGKLQYMFSASTGGSVLLMKAKPLILNPDSSVSFGIRIFGDLSGNQIKYFFAQDSASVKYSAPDTINWAGWKLATFKVSGSFTGSDKIYYGIYISRIPGAAGSGTLYLDDAQFSSPLTAVEKNNEVPAEFALYQNYPNPFNPSTSIKFRVAERGQVTLKIYDMLGREAATLVNRELDRGEYTVNFSAGESGREMTSGIYFYTLRSGEYSATRKLLLLK